MPRQISRRKLLQLGVATPFNRNLVGQNGTTDSTGYSRPGPDTGGVQSRDYGFTADYLYVWGNADTIVRRNQDEFFSVVNSLEASNVFFSWRSLRPGDGTGGGPSPRRVDEFIDRADSENVKIRGMVGAKGKEDIENRSGQAIDEVEKWQRERDNLSGIHLNLEPHEWEIREFLQHFYATLEGLTADLFPEVSISIPPWWNDQRWFGQFKSVRDHPRVDFIDVQAYADQVGYENKNDKGVRRSTELALTNHGDGYSSTPYVNTLELQDCRRSNVDGKATFWEEGGNVVRNVIDRLDANPPVGGADQHYGFAIHAYHPLPRYERKERELSGRPPSREITVTPGTTALFDATALNYPGDNVHVTWYVDGKKKFEPYALYGQLPYRCKGTGLMQSFDESGTHEVRVETFDTRDRKRKLNSLQWTVNVHSGGNTPPTVERVVPESRTVTFRRDEKSKIDFELRATDSTGLDRVIWWINQCDAVVATTSLNGTDETASVSFDVGAQCPLRPIVVDEEGAMTWFDGWEFKEEATGLGYSVRTVEICGNVRNGQCFDPSRQFSTGERVYTLIVFENVETEISVRHELYDPDDTLVYTASNTNTDDEKGDSVYWSWIYHEPVEVGTYTSVIIVNGGEKRFEPEFTVE